MEVASLQMAAEKKDLDPVGILQGTLDTETLMSAASPEHFARLSKALCRLQSVL